MFCKLHSVVKKTISPLQLNNFQQTLNCHTCQSWGSNSLPQNPTNVHLLRDITIKRRSQSKNRKLIYNIS